MNYLKIKSTKTGKTFTFDMTEGAGRHYIYVWIDGAGWVSKKQIAKGGDFMGSMLMADEDHFEQVCRSWLRAYIKNEEAIQAGEF